MRCEEELCTFLPVYLCVSVSVCMNKLLLVLYINLQGHPSSSKYGFLRFVGFCLLFVAISIYQHSSVRVARVFRETVKNNNKIIFSEFFRGVESKHSRLKRITYTTFSVTGIF